MAPDPACYLTGEESGLAPDAAKTPEAAQWLVPVQQNGTANP